MSLEVNRPVPSVKSIFPLNVGLEQVRPAPLAKAISMASMKLFGTQVRLTPYLPSYVPTIGAQWSKHSGGMEEETAVRLIEDVALRSNVVYQFAEMKLLQIIPTSSSSGGGGCHHHLPVVEIL